MAKHTIRLTCSHPGCTEGTFYGYDTLRELREGSAVKMRAANSWKCLRHDQPEKLLSPTNLQTVHTEICVRTEHGQFWQEDGATRPGSGFAHGPGFRIYAQDVPVGARIVITATLEMPAAQPAQAGADRAGG